MTTVSTLAQAEAAARLRAVVARLSRTLRQQSIGELTLSLWSALASVEQDGPMRIGELAERERVSAPTATRLVAALEERGLVTREVGEDDRRASFVRVTTAGVEALAATRRARTAVLATRLAALDGRDLARLLDALPVLEGLATDS
jgi:DNA-binding MarR family transcriptional regulator